MTADVSRFTTGHAPCGRHCGGDRYLTEDRQGLVTEDLRYACGCRSAREEFHDGSIHRLTVHHNGKLLVDEELRGG